MTSEWSSLWCLFLGLYVAWMLGTQAAIVQFDPLQGCLKSLEEPLMWPLHSYLAITCIIQLYFMLRNLCNHWPSVLQNLYDRLVVEANGIFRSGMSCVCHLPDAWQCWFLFLADPHVADTHTRDACDSGAETGELGRAAQAAKELGPYSRLTFFQLN